MYNNHAFDVCIFIFIGLTDLRRSQLRSLQTILYVLSVVAILIELVQLINQRLQYFLKLHSYLEILIYVSVILFIQVDSDECFCAERTVWQLGALACVLSWLNLVYILKRLPFTAIPINMMLNIIITFLSVVLLPILLILTFALPFYMLLSNPVSYLSSYHSIVMLAICLHLAIANCVKCDAFCVGPVHRFQNIWSILCKDVGHDHWRV